MSKNPKRIRRTFSDDFKQDVVNLVVKQGYSFAAAAKAVDASSRSLREWHAQLAPEPEACDETSSRSQKGRSAWPWSRMNRPVDRYLPQPKILHPYPNDRFRARLAGGAV